MLPFETLARTVAAQYVEWICPHEPPHDGAICAPATADAQKKWFLNGAHWARPIARAGMLREVIAAMYAESIRANEPGPVRTGIDWTSWLESRFANELKENADVESK